MKLNKNLYEKICKITRTDYELAESDDGENVLAYHDLDTIIEDLVCAYGVLEEKLEDTIKDREENYKLIPFNPYDEYGVSESDFH